MEVGLDEAGRGPLFGGVFAAAVVLNVGFAVAGDKDSKMFTSEKKRKEAAEYIKAHSVWSIAYMDETMIDKVNILQATMRAMHEAVLQLPCTDIRLLVDGNYFKPLFRMVGEESVLVPFTCIEKGDVTHPCISAASILAKVSRDDYVLDMCRQHPELERYGLTKNKGYGTQQHRDALAQYGRSEWHRKSFKF